MQENWSNSISCKKNEFIRMRKTFRLGAFSNYWKSEFNAKENLRKCKINWQLYTVLNWISLKKNHGKSKLGEKRNISNKQITQVLIYV